jgi:glutaredoxin
VSLARFALVLGIAAVASAAAAQQLYRWTDEKGRTHITDTPPPASAKDKRVVAPGAGGAVAPAKPAGAVPYALDLAMKQYPVTLYTSPGCADPCAGARELLNRRGVPFKEVQVWEEEGNEQLKKLSGDTRVPTIQVGSSVYSGFERASYDGLLDSAGYPRAGVLPQRAQAAPGRPEGYVPPEEREKPKAEPVKPEAEAPAGPYAPGAPPRRTLPR